jgi:hypothetical protein
MKGLIGRRYSFDFAASRGKSVDLIFDNPFRVLGLSAAASTRDIAKRVSDLETFAELGKHKSFPTDVPSLGKITRTVDAVRAAAKKIEQKESKLYHSFFWFRVGHEVDQLALDAMNAGNYCEAFTAWNAELSKNGARRYTSRLNRAVLNLCLAVKDKGEQHFIDALEDLGFLIDDYLRESVRDVLGSEAGLNRESLWKQVSDALIFAGQGLRGAPFGSHGMGLLEHRWTLPAATNDYFLSKLINPHVEKIEAAIEQNASLRKGEPGCHDALMTRPLKQVEPLLTDLKNALGETDSKFQTMANTFANELCSTAIYLSNEVSDEQLASTYIAWAESVPSYGQVRERILENREIIQHNVRHARRRELTKPLMERMKVKVFTLDQAATQLGQLKSLLATLKLKTGGDEEYREASDACAQLLLGFVVKAINEAMETVKETRDFGRFHSLATQAVTLIEMLQSFDMSEETRTRLVSNTKVLHEHHENSAKAVEMIRARDNKSLFESIPVWVWIVGFLILVAMLN